MLLLSTHYFKFMQIEETHFNPKFPLLSGQKEILKNIIEWKDAPPVVKSGRSTFLVIDNKDVPFKGIKIKGCGYFDLQKNKALPPNDRSEFDIHIVNAMDGIKEVHYQIKVNENNELDYEVPRKRPFGGQVFSRAKLEFDANKELYDNWKDSAENFPFYFPIGYVKYKDLIFNNENLGVTILGSNSVSEVPLSSYFEASFEDKGLRINPYIIKYWQNFCAPLGKKEPDYFDLLTTIKKLCFEFGRTLKDFHEHCADVDSHFFNAAVNPDIGRVILFDFDHAKFVKKIPAQKYFYYTFKDLEAGLVAVLSNFLLSGLAEGVILFDELSQPVTGYNPVLAFFEGYFGNLSDETKEEAKSIWERMLMLEMNKILNTGKDKIIHIVYDFCEFERNKSYMNLFDQVKEKTHFKYSDFSLSKDKHREIMAKYFIKLQNFASQHKM